MDVLGRDLRVGIARQNGEHFEFAARETEASEIRVHAAGDVVAHAHESGHHGEPRRVEVRHFTQPFFFETVDKVAQVFVLTGFHQWAPRWRRIRSR